MTYLTFHRAAALQAPHRTSANGSTSALALNNTHASRDAVQPYRGKTLRPAAANAIDEKGCIFMPPASVPRKGSVVRAGARKLLESCVDGFKLHDSSFASAISLSVTHDTSSALADSEFWSAKRVEISPTVKPSCSAVRMKRLRELGVGVGVVNPKRCGLRGQEAAR